MPVTLSARLKLLFLGPHTHVVCPSPGRNVSFCPRPRWITVTSTLKIYRTHKGATWNNTGISLRLSSSQRRHFLRNMQDVIPVFRDNVLCYKVISERTWISHLSKSHARCKNPGEKVWEAAVPLWCFLAWSARLCDGADIDHGVPTLAAGCLSSPPWLNNYVHQGIQAVCDVFSLGNSQQVSKHGALDLSFYTESLGCRK